MKEFAGLSLSVGFEQGICAKLNAVAVNCIGNSGSAKHYAGDFSLESNCIIQNFGSNQNSFRADGNKITI